MVFSTSLTHTTHTYIHTTTSPAREQVHTQPHNHTYTCHVAAGRMINAHTHVILVKRVFISISTTCYHAKSSFVKWAWLPSQLPLGSLVRLQPHKRYQLFVERGALLADIARCRRGNGGVGTFASC